MAQSKRRCVVDNALSQRLLTQQWYTRATNVHADRKERMAPAQAEKGISHTTSLKGSRRWMAKLPGCSDARNTETPAHARTVETDHNHLSNQHSLQQHQSRVLKVCPQAQTHGCPRQPRTLTTSNRCSRSQPSTPGASLHPSQPR